VRASVLLHGAPGSGRSTAAAAVAAAFGAHLVSVNCHDLKASLPRGIACTMLKR
jgi:MoxR-like ATPase